MTTPFEIFRHWLEYYGERPFGRLVRLFAARIFRGGGDADTEGLDLGIGLVLTLLAMPGGFVSLFLLNKYGTFLQWLRGATFVDPLAVSYPDEYFFIVLSMTVTGAVAVWRWDAIFPDRRDYINLVPLPISTRSIFLANLVAVLFLVGLVAVDVNGVSCVLFPMVVGATQTKFMFFAQFAMVHAVGVLLASVFSFLAVFAMLGLLMAILPPRAFKRASAYARGVVVIYVVTLLCTSFAIPGQLHLARESAPAWMLLFPSTWFLSLCQVLRGRATPAMIDLARLALPGLAAVVLTAFGAYALGYRRHFVRIAEMSEAGVAAHTPRTKFVTTLLDRLLLRTPFQRGGFHFVWKTLLRSENHRLVLTAIAGLGLVVSSQALMNAFDGANSWRAAAMSADALSIPFVLSFLIILGLRMVFEIPVELRSNWIFQLMLDPNQQECAPLARKVILSVVLPLTAAIAFPAYAYFAGITVAALHTLVAGTWAVLLTNIALARFRKLPFTCTLPVFKQHSIVIVLSCGFGFLIYAVSTPEFETTALLQPVKLLSLIPIAIVAWYIPHRLAKNSIDLERRLIFEESAPRTVQALGLSD